VPRRKKKTSSLSVFKGREAKLNKAIFHILALKGPQTIYDIHKEAKTQRKLRHTRYASVNKRVRALEVLGYVRKSGIKETKAGFKASIYDLSIRTYLAIMFNSINLEELITKADDITALSILSDIVCTHVFSYFK